MFVLYWIFDKVKRMEGQKFKRFKKLAYHIDLYDTSGCAPASWDSILKEKIALNQTESHYIQFKPA